MKVREDPRDFAPVIGLPIKKVFQILTIFPQVTLDVVYSLTKFMVFHLYPLGFLIPSTV